MQILIDFVATNTQYLVSEMKGAQLIALTWKLQGTKRAIAVKIFEEFKHNGDEEESS